MMKKLEILISATLILFCLSCKKEISEKSVNIKYTLTDDVSPVKVLFSVDGDFTGAEWIFNDSYISDPLDKNKSEYIFNGRTGKVKFIGYSENGTKYIGEKRIEIPNETATKLVISGVFFKHVENCSLSLENRDYELTFDYYHGKVNEHVYVSRTINTTGLNLNDTLFFKEPVTFDITGFENNSDYSMRVILNPSGNNDLSNQFISNFYIKPMYYVERNLFIGRIQLFYFNNKGDAGTYFLVSDWKPY